LHAEDLPRNGAFATFGEAGISKVGRVPQVRARAGGTVPPLRRRPNQVAT
jgi:hypothetical protein